MSDLRLKRKGQLSTLQENRRKIAIEAGNALTVINMKADAFSDLETLDTAAILHAAQELDTAIKALREVNERIGDITNELYG